MPGPCVSTQEALVVNPAVSRSHICFLCVRVSIPWPSVQRVCVCVCVCVCLCVCMCVCDRMHILCKPVLAGLGGWHEMIQGVSSPNRQNKQTNSFAVGSWSAV